MRKSRLTIAKDNHLITIKKKVDISQCAIFAMIFLSGILMLFIFDDLRDEGAFWGLYAVCMLINLARFLSVFFGKITVDSDKREISIFNLCRETYRFDEVKELKPFYDEGDPEGPDRYKLIFTFSNGRKSEIETASKEQTEELMELLGSMIFV